jgi:hemerythrin-like domain-containing protein
MAVSVSTNSSDIADTPWAPITLKSYPFQGIVTEDPVAYMSEEMAIIHNALIRSLNAIWHNSSVVSQKDTPAFVNYSLVVLAAIHAHHDTEEEIMFPAFSAAGLNMEGNKEQHQAFHDGMELFEKYLEQVKRNEVPYDAAKTRELLKDFASPLVHHLHEEVGSIYFPSVATSLTYSPRFRR